MWVVVAPLSDAVKSSLVASKVIGVGATTCTVFRPGSPNPLTLKVAYPGPTRVLSAARGFSPGTV